MLEIIWRFLVEPSERIKFYGIHAALTGFQMSDKTLWTLESFGHLNLS